MTENPIPLSNVDSKLHYMGNIGPIEHEELDEVAVDIRNVGWTLGNDCPFKCKQCYSMSAREKGMNMTVEIIDRVVDQLALNGIETVNLGGNEPIFTNGLDAKATLLPYIIDSLVDRGMRVGLTTSGITLIHLKNDHGDSLRKLNDVDVSLDSPYENEHNENRGAALFGQAIRALEICQEYGIDRSIIMCAMNWNFTEYRIRAIVEIARKYGANVRINTLKPVEAKHMETALPPEQFYKGFSLLMGLCLPLDLGEPPLATVTNFEHANGCPCGRTSFRIHSITPDGKIPVAPCVYLHDYKTGDLTKDSLFDIVRSQQFKTFRRRNARPEVVPGCADCSLLKSCRAGCASRSYLYNLHNTGKRSLFVKDPYCPKDTYSGEMFPQDPKLPDDTRLVHRDYLCTWIGKPKE